MRSVLMISAACWVLASADRAQGQSLDYEGLEAAFGEPITLSATGAPKRASDAPANLTIITQEDIRRSGAVDIAEVLDRFAGVQVTRTAAGAPQVNVRGYTHAFSRQLLVLIDGREVYTSYFARTPWASFPVTMEEIQQIELVRGPGTAIFGPNAYSGVVNVITKDPRTQAVNAVEGRAGSDSFFSGSGAVSHTFGDDHGVRLSGSAFRADRFDSQDAPAVILDNLQDPDGGFAALRTNHRFGPQWQAFSEFTLSRHTTTEYFFTNQSADNDFTRFTGKIGAQWRNDSVIISGDVVYAQTDDFANPPDLAGDLANAFYDLENDFIRTRVNGIWDAGKIGVGKFGVEYRRDSQNTTPVERGDVFLSNFAVHGGWDVSPTPWLALNGAARLDIFDLSSDAEFAAPVRGNLEHERTFTAFSANLGATFSLSQADRLRLLFGRGVSAPSLLELASFQLETPLPEFLMLGPRLLAVANPELEPMVTHNFELNYLRSFAPWNATLSASVFYRMQENVIDGGPNEFELAEDGSLLVFWPNIGDSNSFGGEITLDGRFGDHWTYGINYAYLSIDDDFVTIAAGQSQPRIGVDADGNEIPLQDSFFFEEGAPEHEVNIRIGYERKRFTADLYGAYLSDFRLPIEFSSTSDLLEFADIDSRFELGGRLAYRPFKHVEAAIQVNNVLDDQFREGPLQEAERRWFASLAIRW